MRLKPGVSIAGVRAEIVLALICCKAVFDEQGVDLVVTSVCDGKHGEGSLHYRGFACDLRSRHLTPDRVQAVAGGLRKALGPEFDVVVEKDHFHLEYDPK